MQLKLANHLVVEVQIKSLIRHIQCLQIRVMMNTKSKLMAFRTFTNINCIVIVCVINQNPVSRQ